MHYDKVFFNVHYDKVVLNVKAVPEIILYYLIAIFGLKIATQIVNWVAIFSN